MATKKDLVEAYSFSRRRLVTAFVSGAPGGREVEPARPGRMIVGGVALAILLIAGAAVAGALTDRAPKDWKVPGLVTDDHGALYVYLEDEAVPGDDEPLRQIINVTSAQIILGADVKTTSVPEDELADTPKGPPIGILDAPATVPAASELINSGWISCTASGTGIRTEVVKDPDVVRTPDQGIVAKAADSGQLYLLAEADSVVTGQPRRAYRYPLPADNDLLYNALGVSPNDQITVPDAWLALVPEGSPLNATGLNFPGFGSRVERPGYPQGTRVGDFAVQNNTTYGVGNDGLIELTPFAEALLKNTALPGAKRLPKLVEISEPRFFDIQQGPRPYDDASWPKEVLSGSVAATEKVCGVLETGEGQKPAVLLATAPVDSTMLDGVDKGDSEVNVVSGSGALVRSAGWGSTTGGTIHLIDDRGRSNSVAGQFEVDQLGYGKVAAVVVPESWNKLFQAGADLSRLAALCPPTADRPSRSDADKATCS